MKKNIFILISFCIFIFAFSPSLYALAKDDVEQYIKQIDGIECYRLNAVVALHEKCQANLFVSQQQSADFSNELLNEYRQIYSNLQSIAPPSAAHGIHQKFLEITRCEIEAMEQYGPQYGVVSPSQLISRMESETVTYEKAHLLEKTAWSELAKVSSVRMRIPDFQIRDYENNFFQATRKAQINSMRQYSGGELHPSETRRIMIELYQDWERQVEQIRPQHPYLLEIHRNISVGLRMVKQAWEATNANGEATQTSQTLMEDGFRIFFGALAELYKFDRSIYLNNWIEPGETPIGQTPAETTPTPPVEKPSEKKLMQIYYGEYGRENIPTVYVHEPVKITWYIGEFKKPNIPISGVAVEVQASEGRITPQYQLTQQDGSFTFEYLYDVEIKKPVKKTISLEARKDGYEDLINIGRAITIMPKREKPREKKLAIVCETEPTELGPVIYKEIINEKQEREKFTADLKLFNNTEVWWHININQQGCDNDINTWNDMLFPPKESIVLNGIILKAQEGNFLELSLDRTRPKAMAVNLFNVYSKAILGRNTPQAASSDINAMSIGLGLDTDKRFYWGKPLGEELNEALKTEGVEGIKNILAKILFGKSQRERANALTDKDKFKQALSKGNINTLTNLAGENLSANSTQKNLLITAFSKIFSDTSGDYIKTAVEDFFKKTNWKEKIFNNSKSIEKYPPSGEVRLKVIKASE